MHVERMGPAAALLIASVLAASLGSGGVAGIAHATSHDICAATGEAPIAPAVVPLRSYRPDLGGPTRLALGPDGAIYIADPTRGQVVVRDLDGRVIDRQGDLGHPVSLTFDGAGNLLIGDGRSGSVTAYDVNWQARYRLGIGDGEFLLPNDIEHDATTGRTYVADSKAHLIKVYDAGGGVLFSFGGEGTEPGSFRFPAALHLDHQHGELLVSDQLNFRVQFFTLDGSFICRVGDAAGASSGQSSFIRSRLLSVPQGLWADPSGRIYVADAFEGRVRVIERTSTGRVGLADIGTFGEGTGALQVPSDVVIDDFGRLLVASAGGGRLEIYGIDDFTDPELIAPAGVRVSPNPFDRQGSSQHFTAVIEIPGYRLDEVNPAAITANGVAAEVDSLSLGDRDGDGEPEIEIRFPRDLLEQTLPLDGEARVVIAGPMASLDFEGFDVITVTGGIVDSDGDGVLDDADQCPDTPLGDVIDSGGCSIAQYCPCAGPAPQTPWAHHGRYVVCVAIKAISFTRQGLIGRGELISSIRAAARSACGRRPRIWR